MSIDDDIAETLNTIGIEIHGYDIFPEDVSRNVTNTTLVLEIYENDVKVSCPEV